MSGRLSLGARLTLVNLGSGENFYDRKTGNQISWIVLQKTRRRAQTPPVDFE